MDYKERILEFMKANANNKADFAEWIKTFPEMQQVELMRELNKIVEEFGLNLKGHVPNYENADEILNTFEDAILNKKILQDYIKSLNERKERLKTKMIGNIEQNKMYVISSILNNAPNASEMKQLARQMIITEKKLGIYNPETWRGIE